MIVAPHHEMRGMNGVFRAILSVLKPHPPSSILKYYYSLSVTKVLKKG